MTSNTTDDRSTTGRLRRFSLDLAGVLVLAGSAVLFSVTEFGVPSLLRAIAGLVFVLFLPGYAIISALYPGSVDSSHHRVPVDELSGWNRIILSFGMSVVVTPLVGIGLHFAPTNISAVSYSVSLALVVTAGSVVALWRRSRLPASRRFSVGDISTGGLPIRTDSLLQTALTAVLLVSVLATGGALAFAAIDYTEPSPYSELYVLGENESGALTAGSYPRTAAQFAEEPITVGIENHEGRPIEYTLVVQQLQYPGNGTERPSNRTRLARTQVTVQPDRQLLRNVSLAPNAVSDRSQIQFLLYKNRVPDTPTARNASLAVHVTLLRS
jgi:uncharacterized membrane protein